MNIHYVSGSRADFGLVMRVLQGLNQARGIGVSVVVTGQHLLQKYGDTVSAIEASGLPIAGRIPVRLTGGDGAEMARALAAELLGFVDLWQDKRPDLVLVLGDRGEMLAATLAAVHLGIHVAHLHGGELSGTLDESLRHAISKLAHFHLTATDDARQRLISMGEAEDRVWTIGAPGLVGLGTAGAREPLWLARHFGLRPDADHYAMLVFHPVVQESAQAGWQMEQILSVLQQQNCAAIVLRPNSDAGGALIEAVLDRIAIEGTFKVLDHLDRDTYLMTMAQADVLVGNSSSGILESASFGTPCLNLGSRQNGRLRNANVIDYEGFSTDGLTEALHAALALKGPFENLYGDGRTLERLLNLLPQLPLVDAVLAKSNSY